MDDVEQLRAKIFQLLDDNKIMPSKFAEEIGASQSLVSQWRSGASSSFCRKQYIERIAKFFNVSIDYLIGINQGNRDYEIQEIAELVKAREEIRNLFNIVIHMSKDEVEKATRIITALKG